MDIEIYRLMGIIKSAIEPTISLHRKPHIIVVTRNFDNDSRVRESEISDFLLSIPYFDCALSYYLINEGKIGKMETRPWVNVEWIYNFNQKVNLWAGSNDWLYGELVLIHQPGITKKPKPVGDRIFLPHLMWITNF